jgi:type IV pilus assembly protein PilA
MKNVKRTQGFTLIELLIVIAIIGILAAVLIPNLLGAQKRAYDTGSQSCGKSIQTALATYYIDKNTYVGADTSVAAKSIEGASSGCANTNVTVTATSADFTQSSYSFKVKDSRGQREFTITPSNITGS